MDGKFTVTGRIDAPGVLVELRDYPPTTPFRQTSVQPVYTIGLRSDRSRVRARYPNLRDKSFRSLGPIVFRPAELPWQVEATGARTRVLLCAVDPDRFEDVAGTRMDGSAEALLQSFDVRSGFITHGLAILQREAVHPGPGSRPLVERVTDAMLLELRRHLLDQAEEPSEAAPLDARTLRRVEAAIMGMWDVYPRAEVVAELVGMSSRSLQARFQQTSGETLGEFIARLQMEKAGLLLRTTDLPLKQIAYKVGFAHAANFSTAFRRRHGMTPSAYRRAG